MFVMTAWWAGAVAIVTFALQVLVQFVVLSVYATQAVGFADRASASGFLQALVGVVILWLALGLRPDMPTRRRALLSLLGLVPLWGTLVAIAVELFIEHQQSQQQSEHL